MKKLSNLFFKVLVISIPLILFTGVPARGQDVIMKKNGDEIKAKVEQVLDAEIKYRKFENLTGPIYSMPKAEVFMIKYENGSKDFFGEQAIPAIQQKTTDNKIADTEKSNINDAQDISLDTKRKSPALACFLSWLFPGVGQFYNHQNGKGFTMGGIALAGAAGMIVSSQLYGEYYYDDGYYQYWRSYWNGETVLYISMAVYGADLIWSMIDAPFSSRAINKKNGLSLNYKLNNNIDLAIKPDYRIDFIAGKAFPVMGAKISFDIH